VVANFNLHCGLAEVDVAAVAQFKAHHVLHDPVKPLPVPRRNVSTSEAIREVAEDRRTAPLRLDFRTIQICPKDRLILALAGWKMRQTD
jgi:hypothetical protein